MQPEGLDIGIGWRVGELGAIVATVTVSFRAINGISKTSDGDYIAKTGTLTFNPGETTKTITIEINGDNRKEGGNEARDIPRKMSLRPLGSLFTAWRSFARRRRRPISRI